MSLENRFEISAPIHIGQIATAYPAVEKSRSRKVLLKIIHPQFADDAELVKRFEREGQTMSKVDHPNVVKVYEHGKEDSVPYIVLEWVEGGNLFDKIKNGPLDQKQVKALSKDILSGLEAVHRTGLIHRDIKPDNVMLCIDGSAKLGDFSLSGFANPSGLTEHNAMIGTPAYFAPELVDGYSATAASDLYSVGMILFESLTGSNPFLDTDPIIALGMIRKTTLPSLRDRAGIDPKLAELVDSLLNRKSADRLQSARAALNLLSGVTSQSIPKSKTTRNDLIHWASFIGLITVMIMGLNSLVMVNRDWEAPRSMPMEFDHGNILSEIDSLYEEEKPIFPSGKIETIPAKFKNSAADSVLHDVVKPPTIISYITIIVLPWAKVFQNDKELGVTPLGTMAVSDGMQKFKFVNQNFPVMEKNINIIPGSNDTLLIDLRKESSGMNIIAEPWGYLWIDGDSIGLLPRVEPVWLAQGEHKLNIHHPELGEWKDTINVIKGTNYYYRVNLSKQSLETNLLYE